MQAAEFSIVITCYNQRDFIKAAVDSALTQAVRPKEVIVIDDGSSDGSETVLEPYSRSIQLVRFPENRGAIFSRNHGAGLAKGNYLVFLDGDDALMPWALNVYRGLIGFVHPKVILGRSFWFQGPMPTPCEEPPKHVNFVQYAGVLQKDRPAGLSASTYVVDRDTFWSVGGWSPGIFHLDCQDLLTKLGNSGRMVLICSPPTTLYRIHSANSILSVSPFLRMAHCLLDRERAGLYPGGREHQFERHAWLGGMIFFWMKRAVRAGLYKEAVGLACSGWLMVLAAISRRAFSRLHRRPVESFELPIETPDDPRYVISR